jgi:hypothetical protein
VLALSSLVGSDPPRSSLCRAGKSNDRKPGGRRSGPGGVLQSETACPAATLHSVLSGDELKRLPTAHPPSSDGICARAARGKLRFSPARCNPSSWRMMMFPTRGNANMNGIADLCQTPLVSDQSEGETLQCPELGVPVSCVTLRE